MKDETRVIVRIARDMMRSELKRYDVPPETHVDISEPPEMMREETADYVELRMDRIGPGFGQDATHDFAVWRIPGHLVRARKVYGALREGVAVMCAKLFGVHDGAGLP